MKKNMKKLASFLLMAMLVLGLTACGSTNKETESAIDAAYAESVSEFFVANMTMMETEQMQYYVDMDTEDLQDMLDASQIPCEAAAFQNVLSVYMSSTEDLGEYISTGEYDLELGKEESTMTQTLEFTDHEATLLLIFDEDGVVTSTALDPVYSVGEILQKAALNTVIGMGTVFVVLIFISFIIALLPKVTGLVEGKNKKNTAPAAAPKAAAPAPVVAAEPEELVDDLELVAVISAAIAAYTGSSSDGFVVRSIKRSTTNKWKKA